MNILSITHVFAFHGVHDGNFSTSRNTQTIIFFMLNTYRSDFFKKGGQTYKMATYIVIFFFFQYFVKKVSPKPRVISAERRGLRNAAYTRRRTRIVTVSQTTSRSRSSSINRPQTHFRCRNVRTNHPYTHNKRHSSGMKNPGGAWSSAGTPGTK